MKIVIDIPDIIYSAIQSNKFMLDEYSEDIIKNGTPLPKGHGKLVDQEILFENLFRRNVFQNITLQELSQLIKETTIIEADKEKAEWDNVDKR